MAILPRFLRRAPEAAVAEGLYDAVVAQARQPAFYRDGGVPDTVHGRFELIGLHAFLLLRRLKDGGDAGKALAQAVYDHMFDDMDRSLRELGVGDLGVGKRVKKLAQHFYGCIGAYEVGLDQGDAVLEDALARNLYGTDDRTPAPKALAAMTGYMRREAASLAAQPFADLAGGTLAWGPPPAFEPAAAEVQV